MNVRSNKKVKMVKRSYKKPCSRLASAIAKGKAKAKARTRERALARAGFDLHYMEPALCPNIFDETDSEPEFDARSKSLWSLYPDLELYKPVGISFFGDDSTVFQPSMKAMGKRTKRI